MIRAHTYRLYPTADQAERLAQWVGAVRFVYNLALEQRRTFWRPGRSFNAATQSREVSELRLQVEWLADVPRAALEQGLRDLDGAYRAWWARRSKTPTPRKRGRNDAFRLQGRDIIFTQHSRRRGAVRLPKIGDVRCHVSRQAQGEKRSITVKRVAGQWYAVIWWETATAEAAPATAEVGIDRGVSVFAALSTGELVQGPNVGRKAARSLARAQRALSRKRRGSNRYRKQRLRVARLRARVSAARKDFLHKTSTTIAKNHGLVVLEDLKVQNMTASSAGTIKAPGRNVRQKAGLNRAILDQGWGMFRTMLAYKLEERGGALLTVDPKNTSRTCSACGVIDADSRRGITFACIACGHEAHADTNAAINILRRGTSDLRVEGCNSAPAKREPMEAWSC